MRRPNKIAYGITKTLERNKKRRTSKHETLTLAVRGTLDHLSATNFYIKKVQIEHPKDKGYFKTAFVLTYAGKNRIKAMRSMRANGLSIWEYMYKKQPLSNI